MCFLNSDPLASCFSFRIATFVENNLPMDQFLALIPARYASSRFPGKPLADISGKPMIQHVYERCREVFEQVVVATDDERIARAVDSFGGRYIMTSELHPSGTDRCAEAADKLQSEFQFDIVVNVQGDEPFISTAQLSQIKTCFDDPKTDIATLITPVTSQEILFDPNKVKAITSVNGYALYFSRHPIPYQRDLPHEQWLGHHDYFLHLGLYAFRKDILFQVVRHQPSLLEKAEKLEQLRWLENGFSIKTAITLSQSVGIDTPEDLARLNTTIR